MEVLRRICYEKRRNGIN